MYNWYLEYLLQNDPRKVMSYGGFCVRRMINPLIRSAALLTTRSKCKFHLVRREPVPGGRQIIYAPTHGFKDDVACTLAAIDDHAYILFGSLPQFYNTFDGVASWINGVIMIDRTDRESRRSSMAKMEHYMRYGGNLLMYPEGVWNKSENLLALKLFPGIYRIAQKTNALIVPVATQYEVETNTCYAMVGKALDVSGDTEAEGLIRLRDAMATMKWELMESFSRDTRENLLKGRTPEQYWEDYLRFLISQVDCYDYDVENNAEYIDRALTSPGEAFDHLNHLIPRRENAFLLRA